MKNIKNDDVRAKFAPMSDNITPLLVRKLLYSKCVDINDDTIPPKQVPPNKSNLKTRYKLSAIAMKSTRLNHSQPPELDESWDFEGRNWSQCPSSGTWSDDPLLTPDIDHSSVLPSYAQFAT